MTKKKNEKDEIKRNLFPPPKNHFYMYLLKVALLALFGGVSRRGELQEAKGNWRILPINYSGE